MANEKRSYFVDTLAILFGISAWIGITGTFLQLPQFVATAPEAWKLPSYIVIIVQCGNIPLLAYMIYDKYSTYRIDDAHFIYSTLILGCLAAILMAFVYQDTITINGEPKSVPLLLLTFVFASVGCLSAVLFMPFMGRFREIYLISYMFGQGLNGFISSIVSLIQGVGSMKCNNNNSTINASILNGTQIKDVDVSDPLFGPKGYFIFVFSMLLLSTVAFLLLNILKICEKELTVTEALINGGTSLSNGYENIPNHHHDVLTSYNYNYLMIIVGMISIMNYGILPGIQPYSCLPYGASAYHLATTLSSIANPLACLIAMFFTHSTIRSITIQFLACVALTAIIVLTALESPTPPLASSIFGRMFIVSVDTPNAFQHNRFGFKKNVLCLFPRFRHGHHSLGLPHS